MKNSHRKLANNNIHHNYQNEHMTQNANQKPIMCHHIQGQRKPRLMKGVRIHNCEFDSKHNLTSSTHKIEVQDSRSDSQDNNQDKPEEPNQHQE
jgi:hypothetical protein